MKIESDGPEVRISGDSHVVEPLDLWMTQLPEHLRQRLDKGSNSRFGREFWNAGKANYTREGGRDPLACLSDMAADGISAEVIFPTQAQFIFQQFYDQPLDLELEQACERVYNDWLLEFCAAHPSRLWGQAFLGLWDIDHAIAEMTRLRDAGMKGVTTWVAPPDELPWTSNHYERFWSAAEELEMPVSMHVNNGFGAYQRDYVSPAVEDIGPIINITRKAIGHKMVAMHTIADLILAGVLERHPRLRILIAEFECGWIPAFLEELDRKYSSSKDIQLKKLPSEYFADSFFATFMQDGVAGFLLERWGADNFIYSNDYPHQGGIWPYTDDTVELTLAHVSPATRKKVLSENVARLFGQKLPTPIARRPLAEDDDPNRNWRRPWLKTAEEFTFDKSTMGLAPAKP